MVSAATFASNVMRFCEELDEFWAFTDLLKGMSQRLQHCSSRELLPLMDLPSVKQVITKVESLIVNNVTISDYLCTGPS